MPYSLEEMSDQHRHAVVDIFNYFIAHSFAAYPQEPVDYVLFDRFSEMARGYPSLVVKEDSGEVVGFAFLHPYHSASTLRRTAVITYFIMPEHTRKGLGTAILERFVEAAQKLGVDTILASISSRNEESIRFHRKNGFHECGRFRKVGRKFGQDFDVVWMQLHLVRKVTAVCKVDK
jgi:L-amino acid N-acyltransferase YncA